MERLEKFARKLEPDFEVELDELIREIWIKTSIALLEEYRSKLASLTEEIDLTKLGGISITL
jgi:hypothetical protein